jgi:hypothetical protein
VSWNPTVLVSSLMLVVSLEKKIFLPSFLPSFLLSSLPPFLPSQGLGLQLKMGSNS